MPSTLTPKQRKEVALLFHAGNLAMSNGGNRWHEAAADIHLQCLHYALTSPNAVNILAVMRKRGTITYHDDRLGIRVRWSPARLH